MFKGGMASMMQKAQKMQADIKIAQEEIKQISCESMIQMIQMIQTGRG